MTWLHSPWPLFCDDLDLARRWLIPKLKGDVPVRAGHLAISLGLGAELLAGVQSGALQAEPDALRQWRFRLARLRKESNPYRHLLPDGLFEQTKEALAISKAGRNILNVELNGGIGDHLEALSLIIPWALSMDIRLNLVMNEERKRQIEPLIPSKQKIHCVAANQSRSNAIPIMAVRAGLMEIKGTHYNAWIPSLTINQKHAHHYLCCWRAEGTGDKFSAHSRSVPWNLVYDFYQNLMDNDDQIHIADITHWTKWESKRLQDLGVTVIDPRKGSLLDLVKQCRISRVITIDTALAHLCSASGIEADLLLSLYADERWQELHQIKNNYGQLLRPWRSSRFGTWSETLSLLSTSLREHF